MSWEGIFGREQLQNSFQAAINEGRVSHAYLFCGPIGIGKRTMALALAAALNCDTATVSCHRCLPCRKTVAGTHPDVHMIVPDGKSLKIEQIRKIKKAAYLMPHEGRYQVFILNDADLLTLEAANSLLKVLEEPPASSVFILLTQNPKILPPTVISRCQLLTLPRLHKDSVVKILHHAGFTLSSGQMAQIIQLAEGVPGQAILLAGNTGWQELQQEAVALLHSLYTGSDVSLLAGQIAQRDNLKELVDMLIFVLRDMMVMQATGDPHLLAGQWDESEFMQWKWPVALTIEAITCLLKLHKDIQSPINVRLALERALRRLKEVYTDANRCRNSL